MTEYSTDPAAPARPVASTGINGLDDVLIGGFTRNRLYLVEGPPGSGKTTIALQYLMAGAARGERVLYVTLSETEAELRSVAESHGWDLKGVDIRELAPTESELDPDAQNTMFHPSEVELAEATRRILGDVDELKPACIVFDSLSELRLLAGSPLRYRRQVLALKHFFATRACTVLLLDDVGGDDRELQIRSLAHGVLLLEPLSPEYGADRRRLRVVKYRGVKFRSGYHDYLIHYGGIQVFPRLVAAEHRKLRELRKLPSGLPAFDALIGGGIEEGTSTLIVGPAGTGKSTLAAQFAVAAAGRGERSAIYVFDESPQTLTSRCRALDVDLVSACESGGVKIRQVDPAELTPGEFIHDIRESVEHEDVSIVVIDSLNGYLNAMPEERFLTIQLHELLMYLSQRGVATILIGAHAGLIGTQMSTPVDASYLADAVVLLRYYEAGGEVHQAISVVKKRGSNHERSIREFRMADGRIHVGEPLRNFRGILTGVPEPLDRKANA